MTEAIHKVLCSLNGMIGGLHEQWARELTGVESSLKTVSISGEVPQLLAVQNPRRVEVLIYNDGDKLLHIAPFTGEVGRNSFSLTIAPEETFVLNSHNYAQLYKNDIVGFWGENAATDSRAMITEFYIPL